MLKIRLTRVGRKHDPTYRLVVVDSRKAPQSGAYLENLGFYNPRKVGPERKALMSDFKEKEERIKYWLSQGAQPSGTAHNLLVEVGVIKGEKVNVFTESKKKVAKKAEKDAASSDDEATEGKEAPAEEKPEEKPEDKPEEKKEEEAPKEELDKK